MVPAAGSTSLNRATPKEDFPTKRQHFEYEPNMFRFFFHFIAKFFQNKYNENKIRLFLAQKYYMNDTSSCSIIIYNKIINYY